MTSTERAKKAEEWHVLVRRLRRLHALSCPPQWMIEHIAVIEDWKARLEDELWPQSAAESQAAS